MKFKYKDREFIGDNIKIRVNGGVNVITGKKVIPFAGWNEVREFMYRFEEINREAALTGRRQKYGENLIIYWDEAEDIFVVFWKGRSIEVNTDLLKQLPVILRYFIKNFHKLMLNHNGGKEEFEIETGQMRYTTVTDRT
jgi:hypothetical protein